MPGKMKTFKNTKKIGSVTIHYDEYFDASFAADVEKYIISVSKSQKTNMDKPKEFDSIHVFIYANIKEFNSVFGEAIEKRYYKGKRSAEDMYIVQDADGNIHMASPRGKGKDKKNVLAQILVVKVMSAYVEEKEVVKLKAIVKAGFRKELEAKKKALEKLKEEELKKEIEKQEEEEKKIKEEELKKEKEEQDEAEKRLEEELKKEEQYEGVDEAIDIEKALEKTLQKGVNVPEWMTMGWRGYLKGRLKKEKDIKKFSEYLSRKKATNLNKIKNTKVLSEYNHSKDFATAGVTYIIKTYSLKKFKKIIEDPDNMLNILHTTKFKFNRDIKAFRYKEYSASEKHLEMEKSKPREITKIAFSSLGTDIEISDNENLQEKDKIIE